MDITTQPDGTILATVSTDPAEYVVASPTGIAVRMELLGYEDIPETIRAIHDMRDPSGADPANNVWSGLYTALHDSLTTTATTAADDEDAPDPLTQTRNRARQALGLPEINTSPAAALAAAAPEPLPDGLAEQVAEARTRFRAALAAKTR